MFYDPYLLENFRREQQLKENQTVPKGLLTEENGKNENFNLSYKKKLTWKDTSDLLKRINKQRERESKKLRSERNDDKQINVRLFIINQLNVCKYLRYFL